MIKYTIKDITTKDSYKVYHDGLIYLNQLKKSYVPKTNAYWNNHVRRVQDMRYTLKDFKRQYQMVINMPRNHAILYYGLWNSKDSKKNTFVFESKNQKPSIKTILDNVYLYQNEIKRNRQFRKATFQSNSHTDLMYNYLSNSVSVDSQQLKRIGLTRTEPGLFSKLADVNRLKKWFEYKAPLSSDKHVGVELEGILGLSRNNFAKILNKKYPELINNVNIKDDGSIKNFNNNEYPVEFCLIDHETKIGESLKKLLSLAIEHKFRVNETCGLHVHLDMRTRDHKKAFANLYSFQNFLYKLTSHKRKSNKFCKPIRVKNTDNYLASRSYAFGGDVRYKGINMNAFRDHKTIEIRIHAGCSDIERIESWINLLVKIVDAKDIPKKVSTSARKLKQLLNLDEKELNYIKKYSKIEKDEAKIDHTRTIGIRANSGRFTQISLNNGVTISYSNDDEIPF